MVIGLRKHADVKVRLTKDGGDPPGWLRSASLHSVPPMRRRFAPALGPSISCTKQALLVLEWTIWCGLYVNSTSENEESLFRTFSAYGHTGRIL